MRISEIDNPTKRTIPKHYKDRANSSNTKVTKNTELQITINCLTTL